MSSKECDCCEKTAKGGIHIEIVLSSPMFISKESHTETLYVCEDCQDKAHKLAKHIVKDMLGDIKKKK